jgi:hypothetical protein
MKYAFQMFVAPYRMGANYTNSIIYTVKQRKMGPEQFQELVLSFSNTTQFFALSEIRLINLFLDPHRQSKNRIVTVREVHVLKLRMQRKR